MGEEIGIESLEAVEKARTGVYDLILMDCQMPEMDGFEATQAIRSMDSHLSSIPIVAVTANAFSEDRARCLRVGMDDYLAKPITKKSLQAVLSRWLPSQNPRRVSTLAVNTLQ
jgi:CheY-like chemotaxis protein